MERFSHRLNEIAEYNGDLPAVSQGDLLLTYVQLRELVGGLCFELKSNGIGERSIVGITIKDEVKHLIASLSLLALGSSQITLASHDPLETRGALARRASVSQIIADDETYALDELPCFVLPQGFRPASDGLPERVPLQTQAGLPGSVFLHTSGTTDCSNIVPLDEYSLGFQASTAGTHNDRVLRLASIEHNNSKRHRLYCIYNGSTVVFKPAAEVEVLDYCRVQSVSRLEISRLHASSLLAYARSSGTRLPDFTRLVIAGSRVPLELRLELLAHVTDQLYVRYACTEAGTISIAGPEHHARESAGKPQNSVTVEVVDQDDNPLPSGSPGNIRVRTPGMAKSYLDNPGQSRERFRNGWFHPGDLGEFLGNGELVVHGRADDMIILNSINIFPSHLERVLNEHPAVRESVAVGLESTIHGQIPVAVVELEAGEPASERELLTFARERLALRAPRKILIVDKIPRNSQHKIVRHRVLALFGGNKNNND